METIKVNTEKSSPVKNRSGPKPMYPFWELKVGQSFTVPIEKAGTVRMIATRKSVNGWRFTVRKTSNTQVTVWRTQ